MIYKKFCTIVGSRETPLCILVMLTMICESLKNDGFFGRSGSAPGADTAGELGFGSNAEYYLPWKNAFGRGVGSKKACKAIEELGIEKSAYILAKNSQLKKALVLAAESYKKDGDLYACKESVQNLHSRNAFQVLGIDLDNPSKFTLCYTKNGEKTESECGRQTGGTKTAIRLSCRNGIPVFNLGNANDFFRLYNKYFNESRVAELEERVSEIISNKTRFYSLFSYGGDDSIQSDIEKYFEDKSMLVRFEDYKNLMLNKINKNNKLI